MIDQLTSTIANKVTSYDAWQDGTVGGNYILDFVAYKVDFPKLEK